MDARRRLKTIIPEHMQEVRAVMRSSRIMVLLSLIPGCASMPDPQGSAASLLLDAHTGWKAEEVSLPARLPEATLASANANSSTERPYWPIPDKRAQTATPSGRSAARASRDILPEGAAARAPTGQIFAYEADRVYDVVTAPLRVTVVTLAPGETVLSRAAGDTLRWQIAETRSGSGTTERVHVLLKPLERGLATNLVLATSGRLYLLSLRSGAHDAFDQTVSWTYAPDPLGGAATSRPKDAAYRIRPIGRAPRWTPLAVLTDGERTEIIFPESLSAGEAPALIGRQADGSPRPLSYRQVGNLYLVDEVIEEAELRLGDRQPRVVRLQRLSGASQ